MGWSLTGTDACLTGAASFPLAFSNCPHVDVKRTSHSSITLAGTLLVVLSFVALPVQAQQAAKYGADFLAGGVGARALGMGGAYVAVAEDVSSGYWNASGLSHLYYPQAAYMHVERFAGVVSFDYGSVAWPINARSTVGLSFFRSGVNDIKNTLDAWDVERNQPKPYPENHITTFSAADYAFFVSYARRVSDELALGVTGKVIRRTIGPFADAWGYSFDVSAQYRVGQFLFGANIQDVSRQYQTWSINEQAFDESITDVDPDTGSPYSFEQVWGQDIPTGGTFAVLPVARLGTGVILPRGDHEVTLGFDVDVAFDGQEAYVIDAAGVSLHPRLGTEYSYRNVVALRAGVGRVLYSEDEGLSFTPAVGAGLNIQQVSVDYGFGDFAGYTQDLGFTHRISIQLTLEQPGLLRSAD